MSILNTKIQYYPNSVYNVKPLGECTLREMLHAIKNPKPEILSLFKQIEEASRVGDKKLKDELKSQLYYFTPPCKTDGEGRKYDNIIGFNGMAILDFDGLDYELAKELKQFLFDEYKWIIASFLSSSKKGVKCIARIPIVKSVDEYKEYFYGMAIKLQWIIGWDASSQNCMLPNYLTYDEDLLLRGDAVIFEERGYKENELVVNGSVDIRDIQATEEDRQHIINNIQKSLDKITDSGHFTLRSNALVLWGYCGGSYFNESEVVDIMFDMIDNHPYLSQKAKTYKRTVLDMKQIGISTPIYLDKHEK